MTQWKCEICGEIYNGDTPPSTCILCGSENSMRLYQSGASGEFEDPGDDASSYAYAYAYACDSGESYRYEDDEEEAFGDDEEESPEINYPPGWNDWAVSPVGHHSTLGLMTTLRDHVDLYRRRLAEAQEAMQTEKDSAQRSLDEVVTTSEKQLNDKVRQYHQAHDASVRSEEDRRDVFSGLRGSVNTFRSGSLSGDIWQKLAFLKAEDYWSAEQDYSQDVLDALDAKIEALGQYRDCLLEEARTEHNLRVEQATREKEDRIRRAGQKYNEETAAVTGQAQSDFAEGINSRAQQDYTRKLNAFQPDPRNAEFAKDMPAFIRLGMMGVSLENRTEEDMAVIQTLEHQTGATGVREGDRYVVRLPYAQRLSEGLSLLVRYDPASEPKATKLAEPLVFRLFMMIPPGRLEATMIDPSQMGGKFADLPGISTNSNTARFIDTKVWSHQEDIQTALSALRQQMEDLTQSYGNDMKSRLRKEPLKVLAVTEFPKGFSDAALDDLREIVSNSGRLGVCVLLFANGAELDALRKRHDTLVSDILQCMVRTRYSDGRLMLDQPGSENVFIELESPYDNDRQKKAIIDKLHYELEQAHGFVEPFTNMFDFDIHDSNNWFHGPQSEISIPLGIQGARHLVRLILGKNDAEGEHHALVSGMSGAGKTNLFHTMILSAMLQYSPEELQMYLLDFKEGVEFNIYTHYRLPWMRAVALNSEREFALTVLRELQEEFRDRANCFDRYGVSDIYGYRKLYDVPPIPRLILIFDEVQELFKNSGDEISTECYRLLQTLLSEGRSKGIHIVMASQDFRNCGSLSSLFSLIAIRIVIKGSEESSSAVLGQGNNGVLSLKNRTAGVAIYNSKHGQRGENRLFRICHTELAERQQLLSEFDAYFNIPEIAGQYEGPAYTTRVLLRSAEKDRSNVFNRLITGGGEVYERISSEPEDYGIVMGQSYGRSPVFRCPVGCGKMANMVMIGDHDVHSLSLLDLTVLSLLHDDMESQRSAPHTLIYLADLMRGRYEAFAHNSRSEETFSCTPALLKERFNRQIQLSDKATFMEMLKSVYETVLRRSESGSDGSAPLFFLIAGFDSARDQFVSGNLYDEVQEEETPPADMLKTILRKGPLLGVHTIVFASRTNTLTKVLKEGFEAYFAKRIVFNSDNDTLENLVAEYNPASVNERTAVFRDIFGDADNERFRPYEIPTAGWVASYAEEYHKTVKDEVTDNDVE